MTDDEHRLRELLARATQGGGGLSFDAVAERRRRHRTARLGWTGGIGCLMVAAVVVAAVVASGGGSGGGGVAGRLSAAGSTRSGVGAAVLTVRDVPCPSTGPHPSGLTRAEVKAFRPVAALQCVEVERVLPGQGQWVLRERQVAGTGLRRLQAGFERPLAARSEGSLAACRVLSFAAPLPIALVDHTGRWIVPAAPRTPCGSLPPVLPIAASSWHTVAVQKVQQITSAAAVAAGCAQGFKNENAMFAQLAGARPTTGGPVFTPAPRRVRVCIYRGGAAGANVGTFVRGGILGAARSARLLAALAGPAPRPGRGCPAQEEFAVVSPWTGQDPEVNVELGGCWRVQRDSAAPFGTGSADSQALRSLLGPG